MGPVKLPFADHDLAPLVKRYSSSTIVTMLREIANCKTAKLNWVGLCKGTATGISNPKEYQALWRSIAYRAELDDSYDDNDDSPLEDDSDLDIDLDPVPSVRLAVAESISSFAKSDLQQQELEEARVEQNPVQTGVGHQAGDLSTARLQCAATTQGESTAVTSTKVPYSGAVNQADRKRRRLWTPEEDLALIAAVDECGEGNWTTVLKNHCDFDRSASQLSQRWALIRKRREVQEKAGYGIGSGVSPLASGYKDLRPVAPKSSILPGSSSGTSKEGGKVAMSSNPKPLTSPSSVPANKRLPVSSSPAGALPAAAAASSGVSSGQRPQQTHGRAGALLGHKGVTLEAGVRRPVVQGPGSQVFYTSSQTNTVAVVDSKYAASRTMGAGVGGGRGGGGGGGGGSKGVHGPDPMIQAAAMAAGARIAPASAAASLLKAAQSGNVVHIGSGGIPRSKLCMTSQAGNGNGGGNPGIVHYIRTGSGGALAATSSSLQRPSSHHLAKNQTSSRSFGSNAGGSGNSSPLSIPSVVPAQGGRNNSQAAVQSGKPASLSKRGGGGSSPQQQKATAPALNTTTSASSSNPPSSNPPASTSSSSPPSSTPPSSNPPFSNPVSSNPPPSNPASSTPPTPVSSAVLAAPAPSSSSATPPNSASASTPISTPRSASTTPPSSSTSAAAPSPTSTPAFKSASASIPSLPFKSIPLSVPSSVTKSAPSSAPAAASMSTSAAASVSTPVSTPASAPTPAPVSTLVSAPASASISTPASAPVSTPTSAPISTPAPAPVSTLVSAPVATLASAPAVASISTPTSASVSAPASAPAPARVSAPAPASISPSASAPVSAHAPAPASASISVPAATLVSVPASAPAPKPPSTSVSPKVVSPGEGTR